MRRLAGGSLDSLCSLGTNILVGYLINSLGLSMLGSEPSTGDARSSAFQCHGFNDVGHILALIYSRFDDFKYLFPLDDLHRVALFVE